MSLFVPPSQSGTTRGSDEFVVMLQQISRTNSLVIAVAFLVISPLAKSVQRQPILFLLMSSGAKLLWI